MQKINLVKNILLSTLSTFSSLFLFLLLIFIGKYLGVENLGIFTFALAFVSIFELFLDFGLRDLGVRDIARDKSLTDKYEGNLFIWQLILFIFVYSIMLVVANIIGYDLYVKKIIYILGVATFLRKVKFTFRIFFQAHDRFEIDTLLVLTERTALFTTCILAILLWKDLMLLSFVFLGVRIFDIIFVFYMLHKKIHKIHPQFDPKFIFRLQMNALPRGLYLIVFLLLSYIDTIMLKQMINYQEVGYYNAAYKIYEGLTAIPTIFYLVVLPRLSQLFVSDKDKHQLLSSRVVKYMFVFAVPIVAYIFFFSEGLIITFYKPEYIKSILTLKILAAGLYFHFPVFMLHTILLSSDGQKIILRNGFIALIANIILNLMFIPRYGCHGAACATIISEAILFTLAWVFLNQKKIVSSFYHIAGKPSLAGLFIFGCFMTCTFISDIFLIMISFIVYILLLLVLKVFDRQEYSSFYDQAISIIKR